MTKAQYFEMCEIMGSEVVDKDIPIEVDDLPSQVQICLEIYSNLYDKWDSMVGRYEGKDLSILDVVFNLWEVPREERKIYFIILRIIDSIRAEQIQNSTPKQ